MNAYSWQPFVFVTQDVCQSVMICESEQAENGNGNDTGRKGGDELSLCCAGSAEDPEEAEAHNASPR